jgi:hypothetical protein
MPLRAGERFESVLHDLKRGPHHKDRTRAQELAIAYKVSRKGKKSKKKYRKRAAKRVRRMSKR